jgi:TonB family protein
MKKHFLILLMAFFAVSNASSQEKVVVDSVTTVRVPPQFPKGTKGWHRFLRWKMDDFTAEPNYPSGDFELTVVVSFKVDVTGEVIDVRVHKSSGNTRIDDYAVRVLESSPKWIPATENGKAIKTKQLQTLTFEGR